MKRKRRYKRSGTDYNFGGVLQGIGGIASMFPGIGTAVGAGLGLVGGMIKKSSNPEDNDIYSRRLNASPLGFATGGDLEQLAGDSFRVNADNPNATDSVSVGNVNLDHNEVVDGSKVFSDALVGRGSRKSFAERAKRIQNSLAKSKRMRELSGDTEFKDEKFLEKESEDLFQEQEAMANMLGLRDQQGLPIQGQVGMKYGGKMGYFTGGTFSPPVEDDELVGSILNSLLNAQINPPADPNTAAQFAESATGPRLSQDRNVTARQSSINQMANEDDFLRPLYDRDFDGSTTRAINRAFENMDVNPFDPVDRFAGSTTRGINNAVIEPVSAAELDPNRTPLSTNNLETISAQPLDNLFPQELDPPVADPLGLEEPEDMPDEAPEITRSENNESPLGRLFKGNQTLGTLGTLTGLASNLIGIAQTKPSLVDYSPVGQRERSRLALARRGILAGRDAALSRSNLAARTAMGQAGGRSFQTRNANLRNIAVGQAAADANIQSQFTNRLSQFDVTAGQRDTAIDLANLQRRMNIDRINTQERDAVRTENLKQANNIRKLLIEGQFAQNHARRNRELTRLLETRNFKYDPSSGRIQFVTGIK